MLHNLKSLFLASLKTKSFGNIYIYAQYIFYDITACISIHKQNRHILMFHINNFPNLKNMS